MVQSLFFKEHNPIFRRFLFLNKLSFTLFLDSLRLLLGIAFSVLALLDIRTNQIKGYRKTSLLNIKIFRFNEKHIFDKNYMFLFTIYQ